MENKDLQLLTKSVSELTAEVGEFIVGEWKNFDRTKIEKKGKNDFVSYVDKEAEMMFVNRLRRLLPEAGFITEENTATDKGDRYQWVIDPLDGTTNFMYGIPFFSSCIALIDGNVPVLGVIHEPIRMETFEAYKGGGARCNGQKISVSAITELRDCLTVTGFPYSLDGRNKEYLELLDSMVSSTAGLRRLGSAAIDMAYVAAGRFNAYYEYNINLWDVAAGTVIVKEAGGTVTDFGGLDWDGKITGIEILAAGAAYPHYKELINKYWT